MIIRDRSKRIRPDLKARPDSYPESSKDFSKANDYANREEKKKYPKGYKKLEKIDSHLHKGEILGHINKKGKITISKKVPKKQREEVAYHEKMERKKLSEKKPKRK